MHLQDLDGTGLRSGPSHLVLTQLWRVAGR